MENRIALIGIIVENRESAEQTNALLHTYGEYIVGRMGIPYHPKKINIISIVLDAPENVIAALAGKLGQIPGLQVKSMMTKESKK